jgi:hypothetical protein
MLSDAEARNVVRQLMQRFDLIDAQHASFLHVVAKKDPQEYSRLLEAAEKITPNVTQVLAIADDLRRQAYVSLDDPNADWCQPVLSWLNQKGPINLTRDQADKMMRLMMSDEVDPPT